MELVCGGSCIASQVNIGRALAGEAAYTAGDRHLITSPTLCESYASVDNKISPFTCLDSLKSSMYG